MKAVVLAGGEGTRLRPYTFVVPKPLLPVGDRPVLQIIVEHLRSHGVDEIIVALGYLGHLIRSYFGDGSQFGVTITYIEEREPLGTAGPLALLQDRLATDELVLLMNGDILTNLDFTQVMKDHSPADTDISMGVQRLEEQSPYGVLDIVDDELRAIIEKPVRVTYINAGIYLVNERATQEIPKGTFFTMPQLVNRRLEQGHRVTVFPVDDAWLAVEAPHHLEAANREPHRWLST